MRTLFSAAIFAIASCYALQATPAPLPKEKSGTPLLRPGVYVGSWHGHPCTVELGGDHATAKEGSWRFTFTESGCVYTGTWKLEGVTLRIVESDSRHVDNLTWTVSLERSGKGVFSTPERHTKIYLQPQE